MCGIYGCIAKNKAYEKVLNGLKLLQYRGYDSCGIAYYENNEFKLNKAIGTLDNLKPINTKSNIVFGHTRWATNGEVNFANTHPHVSFDKKFTLVHNGIITNADNIRKDLEKGGVKFYSTTDTEVIANVLSSFKGEIDDRIKKLFSMLEGSFSLIIGYVDGTIYLVKHFSPLNIVESNDGIYISSDISSLKQGELYSLNDGDIIKIKDNKISSLSNSTLNFSCHENTIKTLNLNGYDHFMLKEIYETPQAIHRTYTYLQSIDTNKIFKKYKKITFIGCGTAYHSCLVGEWLFNKLHKYDCNSVLASNYEIDSKVNKKHLHVIVSQSGETADCIKVAENIKEQGGKILIITNEEKSTITKYADFLILTKSNKELAVASTKTYCSQIFVFALIVKRLFNKDYTLDIESFIEKLSKYIKTIDVSLLSDELTNISNMILIGKDIDYLTLLEASLKIRELDYVYTIPMYSGELKHGTLSLIDNTSTIISLNSSKDISKLSTVMNEILSRGGKVIDMSKYLEKVLIDEYFMPIFSIIPFQLLSYYIAINRGYNPDMPRNLAKSVTVE